MFSNKNLDNYKSSIILDTNGTDKKDGKDGKDGTNEKDKKDKKDRKDRTDVERENKLFWCFYIFLYDKDKYDYLKDFYKTERDIKLEAIFKIRENKDLLKHHKIKRNAIEDDLINNKKININTLNCLALVYKINIIYIKNRTFIKMNYKVEEDISLCKNIIEEKNNIINIINILDISSDILKNIFDNYYYIENINKPINAISYYKMIEIIKICKKLNIEINNNKPKLKKDLYNEITSFF